MEVIVNTTEKLAANLLTAKPKVGMETSGELGVEISYGFLNGFTKLLGSV